MAVLAIGGCAHAIAILRWLLELKTGQEFVLGSESKAILERGFIDPSAMQTYGESESASVPTDFLFEVC